VAELPVTFPVYLSVGTVRIPAHLLFEALAYIVGFEVYRRARARQGDHLSDATRWTVIAAAAIGAAIGSKVLFWLEDPRLTIEWLRTDPSRLVGGKTIVGGLLGGTIAVEIAKWYAGERRSTGDLFVVPICAGTAVGRIGCFLGGLEDHTFGTPTSLPWGIDFGDGIARHPTQLYEIVFMAALAGAAIRIASHLGLRNGERFKLFMLAYLTFRMAVDFVKPAVTLGGMSAIQWACLPGIAYYARFLPAIARDRPQSVAAGLQHGPGGSHHG
jgi:phosphatidylglycerol---prolipoprotein diacylglyceryl transferase